METFEQQLINNLEKQIIELNSIIKNCEQIIALQELQLKLKDNIINEFKNERENN